LSSVAAALSWAERRSGLLAPATLGVLMAVAAVLLYRKGLGLTFFFDEWSIVTERRGWDLDTFMRPHNEHIALLPIAVFKLLFVTVGLEPYWIYRVAAIVVHLVCVAVLFILLRRRLGDWPAVIGAAFILFLGSAWEDLLWPFQIGFVGSIAAGLGVLLALESRSRGADALAAFLLVVSLACSSIGLPFAVAVFVDVVLRPGWRARLWVPLTPLALWGLWYLTYGKDGVLQGTTLGMRALLESNLPKMPAFVADMVASGFAALVGLGLEWGRPLALAALIVVLVQLGRGAPVPARLAAVLALGVTYWGLTAAFRAQNQGAEAASKYTYLSAVVILLIAAELLRGTRIPRRAVVLVGLILVFGSVANFRRLQEGADLLHDSSSHVAAELAAVQLAAQHVDPDYQPDPVRAPAIRAGPYLEAVDELGSPADTPNEVLGRPEPVRQTADDVLIHALRIGPFRARPLTAATTPRVVSAEGKVERRAPCVVFRPSGAPSSVELRTEADLVAGNEGNTAAEYRLRSFADGYPPAASGMLAAESRQTLPLGRGQHARPWWILVTAYGPVEFCTAA
jgi:hypothetical protein